WISVSIVGLVRIFLLTHAIRFSAQETELLERKLPTLSTISARRFLNLGRWIYGDAGHVLLREGVHYVVLVYLATGSAQAYVQRRLVGTVERGNFIGEMTVLHDTPATATVTLAENARYFRVEADKLQRLGGRDLDFRLQLDSALNQDTS